ncbi:hypothetical protein [Pseudofrankia sp. BMG5.37]|uniref:hypothetical protein n=1 Tax=Pseudofrankia sp. BMG5.37 TaxID=3050035 RepID=UPI002894F463|nr:hypothetical protein [Pseudofrankia sp. BMG5.37]MDT3443149.1 hypothetical protein [Pseudofrankia sp. BMG5.37]
MSAQSTTSSVESNICSAHLADSEAPVRLVTAIVGIVVGLTFLFGFGNVATLGIRLGVPTYVAFLVAPAVDLSIVSLLIGTRHLALHGGPTEVIRSARRLLIFSSSVSLALNIAEPLIAGHYGKAAFDAVGPLLLIGWAEVGPGLLQAMQTTGGNTPRRVAQRTEVLPESTVTDRPTPAPSPSDSMALEQDLLHRARAEDVLHWQQYHRPISADSLRKRLRVGAGTARLLVARLRSDTHVTLDSQVPETAVTL